jgi:hypothetical protein
METGNDRTSYNCAGDATGKPYGVTKSLGLKPSVLALCDNSFGLNGRRLHTVNPTCADARLLVSNKAPRTATPIDQVDVDAGTIFHELIHLILGNRQSIPPGGEEYAPAKMLGKTARPGINSIMATREALIDPQTYT